MLGMDEFFSKERKKKTRKMGHVLLPVIQVSGQPTAHITSGVESVR